MQRYRRLPAARRPLDDQYLIPGIADDRILFLLDRPYDILKLYITVGA